MNAKLLFALVIAINCYSSCGAALRRTPKVYNALITTDENLTSSRAYPVIQPTIHEPGVAHFPFGPFNPFGFYSPPVVRFGQPLAPGLHPGEQLPYHLLENSLQFPLEVVPPPQGPPAQPYPSYELPPNVPLPPNARQPPKAPHLPTAPGPQQKQPQPLFAPAISAPLPNRAEQPAKALTGTSLENTPSYFMPLPQEIKPYSRQQPQPQPPPKQSQPMPKEQLPIPLNEFGFPPALIPFRQYPNNQEPVSAPSYGYPQYPVVYDPITGYPEPYLAPFDYYPGHNFVFGPSPTSAVPPTRPPGLLPAAATDPAHTPTSTAPNFTPQPEAAATLSSRKDEEEESATAESDAATEAQTYTASSPNFERIKNVSRNKNQAVPDVPPPPIPSGAKLKQ